MQALQLQSADLASLRPVTIDDPAPPARGEAHVRMKAASLNYVDVAVVNGGYPARFPLIPVADGAGEVVAIGEGVDGVAIGDRVIVHSKARWIDGPVLQADIETMRGVTLPGSLVEVATVDAASLVQVPAHLGWAELATLGIPATTAWNALESVNARPGSTVVLLGTGGVSHIAVQLAKARGARVIVTSSSDAKLERATAIGADETINYGRTPDWDAAVRALTSDVGADLVIETVGTETFMRSLAAVRQGGTVFTIGFLSGTKVDFDLIAVISRSLRIVGANTGSAADLRAAVAAIEAAGIKPELVETFNLDRVSEAYTAQAAGVAGKNAILLDW